MEVAAVDYCRAPEPRPIDRATIARPRAARPPNLPMRIVPRPRDQSTMRMAIGPGFPSKMVIARQRSGGGENER